MDRTATISRDPAAVAGRSDVYSLYGLNLRSEFPFVGQLSEGAGEPDLTFEVVDAPPVAGWEGDVPDFASSPRLDGVEESLVRVYLRDGYDVLCLTGLADYYLGPDSIVCHLLDPGYEHLVEIHLLGTVLSLWLELRGTPALHASAAVVEGEAAAFLATSKSGKSSLAAALMQDGYPLLTDDVLAVEHDGEAVRVRPGYPQMRMWPDQARHLGVGYQDLPLVHPDYSKRRVPVGEGGFGAFCNEPRPLACLYLPERRDPANRGTAIEFTQPSRVEGLMTLLGQSFLPNTVEGLGLQPVRMGVLAALASKVPVRKVSYPDGYRHLPRVRQAILEDLDTLRSR